MWTKMGWEHGAISSQLYRPEVSLTGGEVTPADRHEHLRPLMLISTVQTQLLTCTSKSSIAIDVPYHRVPLSRIVCEQHKELS
jgi:hypothetical protein